MAILLRKMCHSISSERRTRPPFLLPGVSFVLIYYYECCALVIVLSLRLHVMWQGDYHALPRRTACTPPALRPVATLILRGIPRCFVSFFFSALLRVFFFFSSLGDESPIVGATGPDGTEGTSGADGVTGPSAGTMRTLWRVIEH